MGLLIEFGTVAVRNRNENPPHGEGGLELTLKEPEQVHKKREAVGTVPTSQVTTGTSDISVIVVSSVDSTVAYSSNLAVGHSVCCFSTFGGLYYRTFGGFVCCTFGGPCCCAFGGLCCCAFAGFC
jgi:hypothetical protein